MPDQGPTAQTKDVTAEHGCPPQARGVETLAVAERFLVWCLRQWVEGWRAGLPTGASCTTASRRPICPTAWRRSTA